MRRRTLAAGLLAMVLAAGSAGAQPARPGSGTQFCSGVKRTVELMRQRGPRAFAILDEYRDFGEDHPAAGRRSIVPGFKEIHFHNSDTSLSADLWGGPGGASFAVVEQISREIGLALSECFPGSRVTEQEEREGILVGVSQGGGRPSFSVRGSRRLSVSLGISIWKPGQWEAFQRERNRAAQSYTSLGCAVGDDLCKTRRTLGR